MDLKAALEFLEKYDSFKKTGTYKNDHNFNLDRIKIFLKMWGVDFSKLKFIHVAGSKGKGYVTNLTADYLVASGLAVGVFTSPHLLSICERIRIGDEFISERDLINYVADIERLVEEDQVVKDLRLSYFEYTWVIALKAFVDRECEYVVVEVGLGGRFDTTNIIDSDIAVLTFLELEHTHVLGNSLREIAGEKIEIRRRGRPFVVGKQSLEGRGVVEDLIGGEADFRPVWKEDRNEFDELGLVFDTASDEDNAFTVFVVLNVLLGEVKMELFKKVLSEFSLPGRFDVREYAGTKIVCDVAHTPASIDNFVRAFVSKFGSEENAVLLSLMQDKKAKEIIEILSGHFRKIYVTQSDFNRGLDPVVMSDIAKDIGLEVEVVDLSGDALERIVGEHEKLAVLGGFTLVEAFLVWLDQKKRP
ncbi:hypothetical protein CVV38_04170 [Candidatus Peregrinibacteria bacterium HGW-Peregrinibacteria-1]|jgi:dihydrofolate synthase/folylpolyglutamate synthase|nr:MAG: hypothetical protein CVV38_04170 [Candidatus Peregrinibacteria bacterium HGW-Peregrinibacteria-1]